MKKRFFKNVILGFTFATSIVIIGSIVATALEMTQMSDESRQDLVLKFFILMATLAIIEAIEKEK